MKLENKYRYLTTFRQEETLYSPKISEDLIPIIYQLAKKAGKPMTHMVDSLLRPQVLKQYHAMTMSLERRVHNGRTSKD